jgi:outer membrane protein, multidrug efflux system
LLALAATIGTPAEVPSAVLQRRPDVLAAERSLRATNANIGAARAARFPNISLTTSVGSASTQLSRLFGNGTGTWTFAPAVSLPIFDAGSGEANVRVAEVARESVLASYEKSIQTAFREVADALAQRRDIAQLLAARQSLVTANEKSWRLTEARYRRGVDSSLAALDAQRSFVSAQQNLITARLLEANNLITLYSVLGGGWR